MYVWLRTDWFAQEGMIWFMTMHQLTDTEQVNLVIYAYVLYLDS